MHLLERMSIFRRFNKTGYMLNFNFRKSFRDVVNIADHIDTEDAAARIKKNIWFKGPNVWILAAW